MLWGMDIKVIGAILIALLFLGFGATAVITYKRAVTQNIELKGEVDNLKKLGEAQKLQIDALVEYQKKQGEIEVKYRDKIVKIYETRSVKDEEGNIDTGKDGVLPLLNGMFNNAKNPADNPAAEASVSK